VEINLQGQLLNLFGQQQETRRANSFVASINLS